MRQYALILQVYNHLNAFKGKGKAIHKHRIVLENLPQYLSAALQEHIFFEQIIMKS